MSEPEFIAWPKIPRVKDNVVTITEKIDGTNACVIIQNGEIIGCQSRKRIIKVGDDNYGFAAWVDRNKEDLALLGDGHHYGEWAGPGIQGNPHALEARTFFLFNSYRWAHERPTLCAVVPVLYQGFLHADTLDTVMTDLAASAKEANYKPEGVIIYHHDTRSYSKATFEHQAGKWAA